MNASTFTFNADKWLSDQRIQDAPLAVQGFLLKARCWCHKGKGRWKDGVVNPMVNPKVNPSVNQMIGYLTTTEPPLLMLEGDDIVAPDIARLYVTMARKQAEGKLGGNPHASGGPADVSLFKKNGEPKSSHILFIDAWVAAYPSRGQGSYAFDSGKDAAAVKRLLGLPGETVESIMATAKAAWANSDKFWCKHAATIAGFASKFNQIRAELNGSGKAASNFSGWIGNQTKSGGAGMTPASERSNQ